MDQLVAVFASIAGAVVLIAALFVGGNALLDLLPRRFRIFAAITGALIGAIVGALANSGGWFLGGNLWPIGGAALGAIFGALVWNRFTPSAETARRTVDFLRPVIFLAPAFVFLLIAIVIPTIRTIYLGFTRRRTGEWNGLDNYKSIFDDPTLFTLKGLTSVFSSKLFVAAVILTVATAVFILIRNTATKRGVDLSGPLPVISLTTSAALVLLAMVGATNAVLWNNFFWIVFVTGASTIFGLAIAILADRSKGESVAKSLIFMPMAISFVGASVIWRFVYAYTPAGSDQIGLLNALWIFGGGSEPQTWVQDQPWNILFLMAIMIWIQTGFAMIVLSASIKAVPTELLEAARVDGASEGQIFWRVTLPQIKSSLAVVITTLIITVLKVYDIVKVMTNGEFGTDVIASRMFDESFINRDYGRGSALAVLLLVSVLPIMIMNIRRMRKGEA